MIKDIQKITDYTINKGPLLVEKIKVLHGANYFSAGPIVQIRLNLGKYDEVFTNQIDGFYESLTSRMPSMVEHYCSIGKRGGFFTRVKEGTLLGHVTEHTAIELQTLAGMDVGYGKTRSTLTQGVYNVIFRFFDEIAGVYAGKAAVNLINSILQNKPFDVEEIIENLIQIRETRMLGPSTQAIVNEAEKRNIPYFRIDDYNLVQIGTGKYQKRLRATITSDTSYIAVETAGNKYLSNLYLHDAGIPVPNTIIPNNLTQVLDYWKKIKSPVTLKPCFGKLGTQVYYNLNTDNSIKKAYNLISQSHDDIIIQPYIKGDIYRLLVIKNKFTAAVKLEAPYIVGDGKRAIQALIEELNSNPKRKQGDKSSLSKVVIDEITERILEIKNYTFETILPENEILYLQISGNPKLGGTSVDVTDTVHEYNKFIAERAGQIIGLDTAGIDIITPDISQPLTEKKGFVLEVNAAPDFRMHLMPIKGKSRPVAKKMVDSLFPEKIKNHVPLISITGTVGKTITAYLIDYCLRQELFTPGLTTTEGLYINGTKLLNGNRTYPEHVSMVLKDTHIDAAVLETSREGIIRRGLGYKYADIGIVLNLKNDHVGADDIKYIEDLAYAKSVVAEEVYENGYTILNADNDLVYEMNNRLYSQLILFSKNPTNRRIINHKKNNGICTVLENDTLVIYQGINRMELCATKNIPLLFQNKAIFLSDSILATASCLYALHIKPSTIAEYFMQFSPSYNNIPGRMNMFFINNMPVLLDYAHNKNAFECLKEFLNNFENKKIGVIDAAGDRLDNEIIELGKIAADTYDILYLYEGYDMRKRKKGSITNLLKKGALENGFDESKIHTFTQPQIAWQKALEETQNQYMIVILSGRPEKTFDIIKNFF